ILVSVLSWRAALVTPSPAPVSGLRIVFQDGPTLPREDVLAWVKRGFPQRASLVDPDQATLERLAEFLRSHGAVREVHQVRVAHEAFDGGVTRIIEIGLSLREPYMPAVLVGGERHWIDAEGRVLPGILPAPAQARPVLRGIEVGGPPAVAEALALWRELESQVEPGLITDIHLFDDLDLKDQRGIVLATRQGSRLIWGRPDEDRFGVDRARKIRDLVHTIRCQGDLSRIAVINVRFGQPFFVLR
nr:cell division protein FtsQ [Planctomycetota bacterium]